jgi:hypothetical protein
VTLRNCRLLGYRADETKGYWLDDAEIGKLITSQDVQFIEDRRPNGLAVIEGSAGGGVCVSELTQIQSDSLLPVVPQPAN